MAVAREAEVERDLRDVLPAFQQAFERVAEPQFRPVGMQGR
jgi:hypothetical protein